jgi:hypothetical protein
MPMGVVGAFEVPSTSSGSVSGVETD